MSQVDGVLKRCVDDVWDIYDKEGEGAIDAEMTKKLVIATLCENKAENMWSEEDFDKAFEEFDKYGYGYIEKRQMPQFLRKLAGI